MLILLPVIIMLLTGLVLLILRFARPNFKYPWMVASLGAILAFASVFLWQIHFPQNLSMSAFQLPTVLFYVPAWLADGISWPFALALSALSVAVIGTSVVRSENEPMAWVGTLALTALGILAVSAENPFTLLLVWSAIDLFELMTMLRSTEGETQRLGVIIAFSARLAGTGLVMWANLVSVNIGSHLDFRSIPPAAGTFLLIAAGLRLGVLPLHLPYRQDNVVRRGFGTALRLVSAGSSLALLARIPASAGKSALTPYLLILAAIAALYAGWMWLRTSDEIQGRPFWIVGLASLAIAESLLGNSAGSTAWGVSTILCGGVLFLFSARRRSILWLPILTLWALSSLPYSLSSPAWQASSTISWLFLIPFLPAQALLMAGFLRHALHPGETSLESQEKWVKIIYPISLLFLVGTSLLLGFWGWIGARMVGPWWLAIIVLILAAGFSFLAQKVLVRIPVSSSYNQWTQIFRLDWLYSILNRLYSFFRKIADIITATLEGEGGLLWSFLLLVLILSILSTRGQ